jgi:hypothetical protein
VCRIRAQEEGRQHEVKTDIGEALLVVRGKKALVTKPSRVPVGEPTYLPRLALGSMSVGFVPRRTQQSHELRIQHQKLQEISQVRAKYGRWESNLL